MVSPPVFSPQEILADYLRGKHDELSESLLTVLRHFRDVTYRGLDKQGVHFVNEFVKVFLHLFTQADYNPSRSHLLEFVRNGSTISNLVALSSFQTTGSFLRLLDQEPNRSLGKILALLSARNAEPTDPTAYFDEDSSLANAWFGAYGELAQSALIDPVVTANLNAHFQKVDERIDVREFPPDAYFGSTYLGDGSDKVIKAAINRSMKRAASENGLEIRRGVPDPRKIAVLSGNWFPEHSVYRITSAYIEALKSAGYHLTFIRLGRRANPDLSPFDDVKEVAFDSAGMLDTRSLQENDFIAAVFPDVGLTLHSVVLANLRVAPTQVALLGHSVSTFGAELDGFISGDEVEREPFPEANYSERLILLPGSGAVHDRPNYTRSLPRITEKNRFLINAPWNAQKINYEFCFDLLSMIERSRRKLQIRIYASASLNRRTHFLPFARQIAAMLGAENVEVVPGASYADYMAMMEEGEFTLDSFPFGGCNTVADSLYLRKLIVCREGDQWYNRIGPRMLRMAGLPELVCTSASEYIEVSLRLIEDDAYRASLQERLDTADLDATIFNRDEAQWFPRALARLIEERGEDNAGEQRAPIRFR